MQLDSLSPRTPLSDAPCRKRIPGVHYLEPFFLFGIEPDHVIGNDIGTYVIASRDTCHLYNVVHRGGSGLYITRNFGLGIEITFSSCHPPAPDPLLIDE